ncbi:ComF family protein [bacterium D16-34]|nr:ComF family protein [bacterium D16-34]
MNSVKHTSAPLAPASLIKMGLHFAASVGAETLWPTQCVVCNKPGEILCEICRINLPYIDQSRACTKCGAPFGYVQCSECNSVSLAAANKTQLPFDTCRSVTVYTASAMKVIRTWKDEGERRLGEHLAQAMTHMIDPRMISKNSTEMPTISFIPATKQAYLRRGFDHAEQLAQLISKQTTLPYTSLFKRPSSKDQRKFGRSDRMKNMTGQFSLNTKAPLPPRVLLIDDVMTSGATLFAASDLLRLHGVKEIACLTFARVW